MAKKLKIADWLVHGGHQYEFFKTGHDFFCSKINGNAPSPRDFGRPRNENVNYVKEERLVRGRYDIIMVRSGIKPHRYKLVRYKKRPSIGIAVMQTHTPFSVPSWVKCIVWNSKDVMVKYMQTFRGKKHFYIPHGFDSDEFQNFYVERNDRVLSAVSLFERRRNLLGFDEWKWVSDKLGNCDLLGHGNDDLKESIGSFPLVKLVRTYNKYGVFLNTTTKSAMPRTRAEALMCGSPLITTNNFGIDKYLVHGKSCLFANTKEDMARQIKKVLSSKSMQEDLGEAGREAAIKYFNIKKYIERWNHVFKEALG